MKAWRLKELTYKEVKDTRYEIAVLPIGATEPHNLHLPHGTDFFQAEMIADIACEKASGKGAKIILLPAIPYGVDANMMQCRLPIHVSQFTINQFIFEIMASLEKHGIPKFVLVNHHGGNEFKSFVRDLAGKSSLFVTLIVDQGDDIGVHPEAGPLLAQVVEHDQVAVLALQLVLGPGHPVLGLHGETDQHLVRLFAAAQPSRDVGILHQLN